MRRIPSRGTRRRAGRLFDPEHRRGAGGSVRRSSAGSEGGFTLVEVMVSLAVLAVGLVSIIALFAAAARSHKRAVDAGHAARLAQKVIADQRLIFVQPNPPLVERDKTDPDFPDLYKYDLEWIPLSVDKDTFILRVRVKWLMQGGEESEVFETMVSRKPKLR